MAIKGINRKGKDVTKSSQTSSKNSSVQMDSKNNIETSEKKDLEKAGKDAEVLENSVEKAIEQEPKNAVVSDNSSEKDIEQEVKSTELETQEIKEEEEEKSVIISEPTQAMMEEMQQEESKTIFTEMKGNNEIMAFWRRGGMHVQDRTRCQDTAFCIGYDKKDPMYSKYAENHNKIKVVLDGCGSCEYSLIGVLMFEQEFKKKATEIEITSDNLEDIVKEIFQKMLQFDNSSKFILDNYLFTILICLEYEDRFEVCTCGDGFIVYVHEEQVFFKELEGSEKNEEGKILPNYFAYELDELKGKLSNYKNGTEFELYTFGKDKFSNVGVASDGLRFCKNLDNEEKSQLFSMIYYRLPFGLERFLEEHKRRFTDDFSISF